MMFAQSRGVGKEAFVKGRLRLGGWIVPVFDEPRSDSELPFFGTP